MITYPICILQGGNRSRRDEIVKILRQKDIEVRPIVAGNFTRNREIKFMDYSIHGELKNANDIHENGFFVGNHSNDNRAEIDFLMDVFKKVLKL